MSNAVFLTSCRGHPLAATDLFSLRLPTSFVVVALPDSAFPTSTNSSSHLGVSSSSTSTLRPPQPHQTFSTPSRPSRLLRPAAQPRHSSSSSSSHGGPSSSSSPSPPRDPVSQIRRAALDVLTSLRLIEEAYRLPEMSSSSASEDEVASSLLSSTSFPARAPSPSGSATGTAWELGRGSLNDEQEEAKIPWEDRLGYHYMGGQTFEGEGSVFGREKKVVLRYLEVVDEVLFGGGEGGKRGWDKGGGRAKGGRRKSSLGVAVVLGDGGSESGEGDEQEEEDAWLDENASTIRQSPRLSPPCEPSTHHPSPLSFSARLHSLLSHILPPHLLHHLAPTNTATATASLASFTNGQLLCHAFNAAVRTSKRPWGYVPEHDIHDVLGGSSVEGAEGASATKKEYVYRKVENLRVFAA